MPALRWLPALTFVAVTVWIAHASLSSPAAPSDRGGHAREAPQKVAPADVTLQLTATCDAGSNEPTAVTVALSVPLDGRPVFQLDDEVFGVPGMASLVLHASAVDQRGVLPLVRRLASSPRGGRALELVASRTVAGTVTLRYLARSVPVAGVGALHGLRHDATGIGGLGAYFVMLPASQRVHRIHVEWTRPACATTSGSGTISLAAGAPATDITGPLDRLRTAVYFFGRPRVVTIDDGAVHMCTAWFGDPSLDVAAAAAWAARAFAAERRLFGDDAPIDYAVFVRVLPALGAHSSGVAQPASLLLAIGPHARFGPRTRTNIAHEMLHHWLGQRVQLSGPDGPAYWFSEGFTVHYANIVLLHAGLISPDEFLAELNLTARRHFASAYSMATNREISHGFFKNHALSLVPYTRGALYAAEVDAAIRRASHGARSLDDVMRELDRAARSTADGPSLKTFRAMIDRALGPPGVERFDAVILRGARPEPPTDAFGPCFAREPRTIAAFELGFDEPRSLVAPRAIRGLVAGSSAARAGLVEGDPLESIEAVALDPESLAVVTVHRGGRRIVVRYLPARAGSRRDGFQWARVPGTADPQCGAW